MKDKLFKRRPHVDWYSLRLELGDPDVEYYYWLHFKDSKNPKKVKMSVNRKSYYALLYVYGRKRLMAYRYSGVWR